MFIFNRKKWSFRISIATLMITLTLSLSAAFLVIAHRTFNRAAEQSSDRLFGEISGKLIEKVDSLLYSVESVAETGVFLADSAPQIADPYHHGTLFLFMINALKQNSRLHALFWENQAGTMVRVVSLHSNPLLTEWYGVDPKVAYVARVVEQSGRISKETHFDESLREVAVTNAGARTNAPMRPWRDQDRNNRGTLFTGPYVFASEPVAGITCTKASADGKVLFGADTTLAYFTDFLWEQIVSRFGYAFVFDRNGYLLAHPREASVSVVHRIDQEEIWFLPLAQSRHPEVREIWSYFQQHGETVIGRNHHIRVNQSAQIIRLAPIDNFGLHLLVAVTAPVSDFTSAFYLIQQQVFVVSACTILFVIIASFVMAHRVSHALSLLAKSAQRVQQFDFSEQERLESVFIEIHTLIQSFSLMRKTVRQKTDALLTTQAHLKYLVDKGIALAGEQDDLRLTNLTFDSARYLSIADGGLIYRADDHGQLQAVLMQRTSQGIELTQLPGDYSGNCAVNLDDNQEDLLSRMAKTALDTGTITTVIGYSGPGLLPELAGLFGRFHSVMFVPLKTHRQKVVGLLQLVKPIGDSIDEPCRFDRARYPFIQVLAAQAAIAMDNQNLVKAQRLLMDSFIKVIANTIDAKSPHTGRHCSRIPELALLLARAAHATDTGSLAEFHLDGEEAWREFEVAAWLHDCGKLTTPDDVVNKATKLETRYNRIHEVRMRFEVLRRDLEIEYLQTVASDRQADFQQTAALHHAYLELENDFAFIAARNTGGETLDQKDKDRILTIAAKTWKPYFNSSLGLSEEESSRQPATRNAGQPEYLLADKPEHLEPFEPLGNRSHGGEQFNLQTPLFRFNRGEIHNLLVEQGTLTAEERFAIQDHIIQTIYMLEQLPFPEYLARVPEYACSHHEKINGSGYPRGLKGEEMSVPARILAIVDIFEALTAADRPYKQPMRVTEALAIMRSMCNRNEIDAELFDLFQQSDVVERYGQSYLRPEQMAAVPGLDERNEGSCKDE